MKTSSANKWIKCLLALSATMTLSLSPPKNDSTTAASPPKADATTAETAKSTAKSAGKSKTDLQRKKKRGGELYEEYATVIHTKRLRSEFTAAQWKTILLQKRVRVPLTAKDHRDLQLFFINE